VPINTRFAAREIIYCLEDMDGPWICCDDEMLLLFEGIRSSLHGTRGLIYIGTNHCPEGYVSYDTLLKGDPGADTTDPAVDDIAIISPGEPPVCPKLMLTHAQMLAGSGMVSARPVRTTYTPCRPHVPHGRRHHVLHGHNQRVCQRVHG
jgi:hypothetical protein